MIGRLFRWYAAHRFAVMFYSFLVVVMAGPLLTALELDRRLGQVVIAVNLAAATAGTSFTAIRRTLVVLTLAAIVILVLPETIAHAHGLSAPVVLWSVLAWLGAFTVVRFAMFTGEVSGEHVYAALDAYLIAGLYLGLVYHAIDGSTPGSFLVLGAPATEESFTLSRAIYFSFITLSTLGYGDIVPNSEVTRGLAVLEAVAGQLYVAVLVARLVGSFRKDRRG